MAYVASHASSVVGLRSGSIPT